MSLRWRLPLTYLLLIGLLLGAVTTSLIPLLHRYLLEEKAAPLRLQAAIIANSVRDQLPSDPNELQRTVQDQAERLGSRVLVLDAEQRVAADSVGELTGKSLSLPIISRARAGNPSEEEQQSGDERALYLATPILRNQQVMGVVFISSSTSRVYETLAQLQRNVYVGVGLVAVAAALISLALASGIIAPLTALTRAVQGLNLHGDTFVPIRGPGEVRTLAQAFNEMVKRLHFEDETRKRFISDVSHELRTPLAAMKTVAETLVMGEDIDVQTQREFLQDLDGEVDRLTHLVRDLFDLAQLDRHPDLVRVPVSMSALAQRVVRQLTPLAQRGNMTVQFESEAEPLIAYGDEELLHRALLNLVDNAIKYSSDGGQVQLRVRREQGMIHLSVADHGPGIPSELQERVFQRFFRADPSRARASGGAGLGLAIAQEIALLHGGHIQLISTKGQGSIFTLVVPAGDESHSAPP